MNQIIGFALFIRILTIGNDNQLHARTPETTDLFFNGFQVANYPCIEHNSRSRESMKGFQIVSSAGISFR